LRFKLLGLSSVEEHGPDLLSSLPRKLDGPGRHRSESRTRSGLGERDYMSWATTTWSTSSTRSKHPHCSESSTIGARSKSSRVRVRHVFHPGIQ
jgi:hypothetical protein